MKLTLEEFMILMDTLRNSLRIHDKPDYPLFGYCSRARERLLAELHNKLHREAAEIEVIADA